MKFKYLIILFFSLFCLVTLAGESPAPLAMLEQTSEALIDGLKKNQSKIKSQPQVVNELISRTVLPNFDIEGIAHATVGHFSKEATSQEWVQFKKKVIGLVMKNYAAPLASFDDDEVQFFPIREFNSANTHVEVKSLIIRKNGQKIPVTYRLTQLGDKGWKISDFSVEGVSMVQSYRSQFMPVLSQKGFKGLLDVLNNRRQ